MPSENSESPGTPATDTSASGTQATDASASAAPATDTSASGTQASDTSAPESAGPGGTRRRGGRLASLGAATVILTAFGVWATLAAHSLRQTAAAQNSALTDRAATAAVTRQVSAAVNTIFSYSYADTGKTRRAAQSLLTGPAIRQYDRLFSLVQADAPRQKLVVTTRVTTSGVEFLAGGRARVLVFANQQDTRAGTSQTSYAGAMFAVTAIRTNGRWKIENIDTFTGTG